MKEQKYNRWGHPIKTYKGYECSQTDSTTTIQVSVYGRQFKKDKIVNCWSLNSLDAEISLTSFADCKRLINEMEVSENESNK